MPSRRWSGSWSYRIRRGWTSSSANHRRKPIAQWVTYVSYSDGTLWRSRTDGTDRLQVTHPPLVAILPRWSPDGTRIAFAGGETGQPWKILLIAANGGTPREVHPESRGQIDVNWSPDGKALLYGRMATPGIAFSRMATAGNTEKLELNIIHLDSDQMSVVPGSENLFSPRWSPDGKYLTAMTGDSEKLMLFDFQTQKWREWVGGSSNIALPKWSRDSRYVHYDEYSLQGSRSWRIRIGTKRPELVVDSTGFQRFIRPFVGPWTGLAPDGSPNLCARFEYGRNLCTGVAASMTYASNPLWCTCLFGDCA